MKLINKHDRRCSLVLVQKMRTCLEVEENLRTSLFWYYKLEGYVDAKANLELVQRKMSSLSPG
jgi:hypothetical protein